MARHQDLAVTTVDPQPAAAVRRPPRRARPGRGAAAAVSPSRRIAPRPRRSCPPRCCLRRSRVRASTASGCSAVGRWRWTPSPTPAPAGRQGLTLDRPRSAGCTACGLTSRSLVRAVAGARPRLTPTSARRSRCATDWASARSSDAAADGQHPQQVVPATLDAGLDDVGRERSVRVFSLAISCGRHAPAVRRQPRAEDVGHQAQLALRDRSGTASMPECRRCAPH